MFIFDIFQSWWYRNNGHRRSVKSDFERKLKLLTPFLSDLKNCWVTNPLGGLFAKKWPWEGASCFAHFSKVVQSKFLNCHFVRHSWTMLLGLTWLPTPRGERPVSYKICTLFVYSICYSEVYRLFGEEEFCV